MEVRGKENIPTRGPLIVVANHPATFLDTIVLATLLKMPLFFLAKAVIFKSKIMASFFRFFNTIPIYRAQDDPSSITKNEETFKECYFHLANGGTLMIFPEGISQSVRSLQKIKTGTARIALGAESQNNFDLDLKILTVGLNYSNQEKFQSHLFVSVDEPIQVKDFQADFEKDFWNAVTNLTKLIEDKISAQIINAGNENTDQLIRHIEHLVKNRVLKDWGVSRNEPEFDYEVTKRIVDAVNHFREVNPDRVSKIERQINNYYDALKEVDLPESIFESKAITFKSAIGYLTYFIFGLPVFLFGFINNYIPYRLSIAIARLLSNVKEYRGAIGFAAGTFLFLIFFTMQFYLAWRFSHSFYFAGAYLVMVPPTGIFAFYYHKKLVRFYYKLVFRYLRKSFLVQDLITSRNSLITQLEEARDEYLAVSDDQI